MAASVIVVGRVSVDLYARELGASFLETQTFSKSIGGSPTNVAVAAAKLGHRSTLLTKVGGDPLGTYVVTQLASWGVDTDHIGVDITGRTPVVIAAMDPPEEPQVIFHRELNAPDTTLEVADLPLSDIESCDIFWMSGGTLARGSTANAARVWLSHRARRRHTVLDLDYRPTFWPSRLDAQRAAQEALAQCTVVVGNQSECEMAVGSSDPDAAATALLTYGVGLAIVKMGGDGLLLATPNERIRINPLRVNVVCGLGAGDAFGGALIHGLASNWDLQTIGTYANAAGAYVASRPTCADSMPDLAQLHEFVDANC